MVSQEQIEDGGAFIEMIENQKGTEFWGGQVEPDHEKILQSYVKSDKLMKY